MTSSRRKSRLVSLANSRYHSFYKVQLLQQDGQPYLPAQNQFPSQMGPEFPAPPGDGNSRRESGGVPPIQMESRPSRIYQSVIDQELSSVNQIEQNMASNMMNLNKQVDQRLEDVLSLKEKEINKLQEEKKRLEASLNEIRVGFSS
jgi:hypothetical protein